MSTLPVRSVTRIASGEVSTTLRYSSAGVAPRPASSRTRQAASRQAASFASGGGHHDSADITVLSICPRGSPLQRSVVPVALPEAVPETNSRLALEPRGRRRGRAPIVGVHEVGQLLPNNAVCRVTEAVFPGRVQPLKASAGVDQADADLRRGKQLFDAAIRPREAVLQYPAAGLRGPPTMRRSGPATARSFSFAPAGLRPLYWAFTDVGREVRLK